MAEQDIQGQELTPDELEAQEVSQLPNREAMSLVSTGDPMTLSAGDPQPVPPGFDDGTATTDPPEFSKGGTATTDPPEYLGPPVQ